MSSVTPDGRSAKGSSKSAGSPLIRISLSSWRDAGAKYLSDVRVLFIAAIVQGKWAINVKIATDHVKRNTQVVKRTAALGKKQS